jgi:hypothetical protein
MFCKNCGKEIPSDARFCEYCGTQNDAAGTVGQAPSQAPFTPYPQTPNPGQPFNPNGQPPFPVQPPFPPQPQYYNQFQPKKPKFVKLFLISFLITLGVLGLIIGAIFIFSPDPKLSEPTMTSAVDSVTKEPTAATDTFTTSDQVIYATVLLSNAPKNTKVTAKWEYQDPYTLIDTVDINSTETNQYIAFSLTNQSSGFPAGEYCCSFFLDGVFYKTIYFTVTE